MTLAAGMEKPQGAENSALKKTAPLSLTPLKIWEIASILQRRPARFGLSARFPGLRANHSVPLAVRASHGDARAWFQRQRHRTIVLQRGNSACRVDGQILTRSLYESES